MASQVCLPTAGKNALVMGPGLGVGEKTKALVRRAPHPDAPPAERRRAIVLRRRRASPVFEDEKRAVFATSYHNPARCGADAGMMANSQAFRSHAGKNDENHGRFFIPSRINLAIRS